MQGQDNTRDAEGGTLRGRFLENGTQLMNTSSNRKIEFRAGLFLACLIGASVAAGDLLGQDATTGKKVSASKDQPVAAALSGARWEAAVASARDRAKLLHDVYTTTLEVMHRHYFRREGAVLPARAMNDIFEEMSVLSGDYVNWIAVNTKAMSIDHEPTTAFEKKAATELAAGKESYEIATERVYRRATPIPLHSRCVGCHTKMFSETPKSPRMAGLVISISLMTEEKLSSTQVVPASK